MGCQRITIIWIGILLLASSVGSVTAEQTKKVEIAALDSPGGPPPADKMAYAMRQHVRKILIAPRNCQGNPVPRVRHPTGLFNIC
jgi:hypothetical protein